jgi:hypothetical protein
MRQQGPEDKYYHIVVSWHLQMPYLQFEYSINTTELCNCQGSVSASLVRYTSELHMHQGWCVEVRESLDKVWWNQGGNAWVLVICQAIC